MRSILMLSFIKVAVLRTIYVVAWIFASVVTICAVILAAIGSFFTGLLGELWCRKEEK